MQGNSINLNSIFYDSSHILFKITNKMVLKRKTNISTRPICQQIKMAIIDCKDHAQIASNIHSVAW